MKALILLTQVTNAFRQRVHLGLMEYHGNDKAALWSPMPFGNESTWDHRRACIKRKPVHRVTNAFRQRVHLGPARVRASSEQAVRSPMPFGNESTWD